MCGMGINTLVSYLLTMATGWGLFSFVLGGAQRWRIPLVIFFYNGITYVHFSFDVSSSVVLLSCMSCG